MIGVNIALAFFKPIMLIKAYFLRPLVWGLSEIINRNLLISLVLAVKVTIWSPTIFCMSRVVFKPDRFYFEIQSSMEETYKSLRDSWANGFSSKKNDRS